MFSHVHRKHSIFRATRYWRFQYDLLIHSSEGTARFAQALSA